MRSSSSVRGLGGLVLHAAVDAQHLADLACRRPRPGSATRWAAGRSSRSGRRGSCASSSVESLSRSWPSNMTSPASIPPGGATRRMIDRDVTLLPQPDSPTRPRISPRSTEKSMPSTARTAPSRVWNEVRRPRTSSSGPRRARASAAAAPPAASSSMTVSSSDAPRLSTPRWRIRGALARSLGVSSVSGQPRVERVAQAVAEEVEAEHGQRERDAREDHRSGEREQLVALEPDHRAPLGLRRLGAEAEERQGGDLEDRGADAERALDDRAA